MLTLIKSTLAIVIEIQKSDQSTHDINALYIRVERKVWEELLTVESAQSH